MAFANFQLHNSILKALAEAGFSQPTPVQEQAIPGIMQGRDVMASAQTGTGKTAAFVLPILHRLVTQAPRPGHGPRALILTPTRELAEQILKNIKLFSKFLGLRTGLVMGGVSYGPQYALLSAPLDILIATPGRLIDHLEAGRLDLSRVEVFVLDEADRMLDMGFRKPVDQVLKTFKQRPQVLLFSATFDAGVEKIAAEALRQPVRIALAPAQKPHSQITQVVYAADDAAHKFALLERLLQNRQIWQVIVFAATKRGADKLAEKLNDLGHPSAPLHGDMRQNARKRTLEQLHKGKLRVLVATDVAARGIDVKDLSHVINFDMPQVAEDYTHRIGRTGRAGAAGVAISLIVPEDVAMLSLVEKITGQRFVFDTLEGLAPLFGEDEFRRRAPKEIFKRGKKPQPRPQHKAGQGHKPHQGAKPHRDAAGQRSGGQPGQEQRRPFKGKKPHGGQGGRDGGRDGGRQARFR